MKAYLEDKQYFTYQVIHAKVVRPVNRYPGTNWYSVVHANAIQKKFIRVIFHPLATPFWNLPSCIEWIKEHIGRTEGQIQYAGSTRIFWNMPAMPKQSICDVSRNRNLYPGGISIPNFLMRAVHTSDDTEPLSKELAPIAMIAISVCSFRLNGPGLSVKLLPNTLHVLVGRNLAASLPLGKDARMTRYEDNPTKWFQYILSLLFNDTLTRGIMQLEELI